MVNQPQQPAAKSWATRREENHRRIESIQPWMQGSILSPDKIIEALELLIKSGDRVSWRETIRSRQTSFPDRW